MQRWSLLALADLFVINRPHTQYRHQRGGDPVKLERGRLARCTTDSRMFSAETIPRELLRAPRQHTAVPVCDTHVVLFRGDSFDAAQWLQDAQGHAPAQIAVLDFASDTEPGGVCVLITYVCGRFMRVPVCVCVCVCLCTCASRLSRLKCALNTSFV